MAQSRSYMCIYIYTCMSIYLYLHVDVYLSTHLCIYVSSLSVYLSDPECPSTQCLRTLVPNTIKGMVFGPRNLKYWACGRGKGAFELLLVTGFG